MFREILYTLLGLVAAAYAADHLLALRDDPREPPRARSRVPLIGHIIGMMRYGVVYYDIKAREAGPGVDMFTLDLLGVKLYVATSQRLTPMVARASRTLSFRPFMRLAAMRLGGTTDPHTLELYRSEFVETLGAATRDALSPGPALDDQNRRTGERALRDVDDLVAGAGGDAGKTVPLLHWCRRAVVQAGGAGVFGVDHPLTDPGIERDFWTWNKYMAGHMLGIDLSGEGYRARKRLFAAFAEYLRAVPADAAPFFTERDRLLREAGVDHEQRAIQGGLTCIAVFSNTAPTFFWVVWELFSRPGLVEDVRAELLAQAVAEEDEGDKATASEGAGRSFALDVPALRTKCPLLLSVMQETQRRHHVHAATRHVAEDTDLDGGRYRLLRDNYLQMPGGPIHSNPSAWGPDADEFDPHRFVPERGGGQGRPQRGVYNANAASEEKEEQEEKKEEEKKPASRVPSSSFVAWGSPPHLCPARQFATTEMLIIAALLALRVDVEPASSPAWPRTRPPLDVGELVTIYSPKRDPEVRVRTRAREPWASGTWSLRMGDSKSRVQLHSG